MVYVQNRQDTVTLIDTVRSLAGVLVGQVQGPDVEDSLGSRTAGHVVVGDGDSNLLVTELENFGDFLTKKS